MSLTITQHDLLVKFLKDVGIRNQEPFEAFYDHFVTAFEKSGATMLRLKPEGPGQKKAHI